MTIAVSAAHAQTSPAAPQGNAEAGSQKVAQCIGCHGIPNYKTAFPQVYRVPRIGGQQAAYIANALHEYAKGDRRHPSMQGIAKSLSEQDILDIAAYYASQPDSVATVK